MVLWRFTGGRQGEVAGVFMSGDCKAENSRVSVEAGELSSVDCSMAGEETMERCGDTSRAPGEAGDGANVGEPTGGVAGGTATGGTDSNDKCY